MNNIKTFESFRISQELETTSAEETANYIWREFTETNSGIFNNFYIELLENIKYMDSGEIRDWFSNKLYILYNTGNMMLGDHQLRDYKRSKAWSFNELNKEDESGKSIWTYLEEKIEEFLIKEGVLK
jgi:hypothetical protein